jgi:hypothetical protein
LDVGVVVEGGGGDELLEVFDFFADVPVVFVELD